MSSNTNCCHLDDSKYQRSALLPVCVDFGGKQTGYTYVAGTWKANVHMGCWQMSLFLDAGTHSVHWGQKVGLFHQSISTWEEMNPCFQVLRALFKPCLSYFSWFRCLHGLAPIIITCSNAISGFSWDRKFKVILMLYFAIKLVINHPLCKNLFRFSLLKCISNPPNPVTSILPSKHTLFWKVHRESNVK